MSSTCFSAWERKFVVGHGFGLAAELPLGAELTEYSGSHATARRSAAAPKRRPTVISPRSTQHLEQRLHVTEGKREGLRPARIAGDRGDVIRHDHVWIADFLVSLQGLDHVHAADIRECLLEIAEPAVNITEVNVENLFS